MTAKHGDLNETKTAIPSSDSLCAMCPNGGTMTCGSCHSIRYCSKMCQKTDWAVHELLCKTYKGFNDTTRPI